MEILVCVKRVPDTAENEIEVNREGTDIDRDDLVYSVNEWDNYAVEEAIQIRDKAREIQNTIATIGMLFSDVTRRPPSLMNGTPRRSSTTDGSNAMSVRGHASSGRVSAASASSAPGKAMRWS